MDSNSDESVSDGTKPSDVRNVFAEFLSHFYAGRENEALALTKGPVQATEKTKSLLRWNRAFLTFRKKMIAAYGDVEWRKHFHRRNLNLTFPEHTEFTSKDLLHYPVIMEGETAFAFHPIDDSARWVRFVREDKNWKLDLDQYVGSISDEEFEMFRLVAESLEAATEKVGTQGVTSAMIKEDVIDAIFQRQTTPATKDN